LEDSLHELLSSQELEALRRYPSPTISDAIETFNVRPHLEGVTDLRIRCIFPALGAVIGYACTAVIISDPPPSQPRRVSRRDHWKHVQPFPGRRVSVAQDISPTPRDIARRVAEAAGKCDLSEKPMLAACELADPVDELDRLISPNY
jgi:hypothetical protein